MTSPLSLHAGDIALASLLLVVDVALSIALRLRFHRALIVASVRMAVQLVAVGYLLRYVFAEHSPWLTAVLVLAMSLVAVREVAVRPVRRLRGGNVVVALPHVLGVVLITTCFALLTAIRPQPWYDPRYAIPLVGILLGSILNAASIALAGVLDNVRHQRDAIEAQLMLGATFRTASAPLLRRSIHAAMVPVINQMAAAGVITLPGTMTGQLLAGADPVDAVKYQILLLILLTGASCLAAMGTAYGAMARLHDDRMRLRLDRLG
ncbi:MAG: iron export ABC transporter permease subunit FetB [Luteibacter sp.]|uniref:ABC transporter permease n=1 Tax=Luteibacter sp. TaxID=1886636 RepID=UPI00280873EE|nr:iron export ABC transporter permease subunit FetB [Luteibacter sp.]MDQ7997835.1 iron export ABC transporter permease subunit FetB [Luteibacter sp.]MDQ8050246.1 iron export ABC transporter permease subunit FetB [Luteibacter sp.]